MSNTADKPISAANLKAVLLNQGVIKSIYESMTWDDTDWSNISKYLDYGDNYVNSLNETKTVSISGYGDCEFCLVGKNESGYIFQSECTFYANCKMNSDLDAEGGWGKTELRTWLNGTFYYAFPDVLKENIKVTTVKYDSLYHYNSSVAGETSTCSDKLWIPSYQEIKGEGSSFPNLNSGIEGTRFDAYTNGKSLLKKYINGGESLWWLRTRSNNNKYAFYLISSNGSVSSVASNQNAYFSPCFCI